MKHFSRDSEAWSRTVVGYAALLLLPPLLVLVGLARFQGLQAPAALDQAQVARQLAQGEGFTTRLIRPLSLAFHRYSPRYPDLYHAPMYPLVLALAYRLTHPSDKVTAAVGGALWILSVWLTFFVGRRWAGPGRAALATVFYGCHAPLLAASLQGLAAPLMAMGLLLTLALAFPPLEDAEEAPGERFDWTWLRYLACGLACGLATLTHYLLGLFALAVGLSLWLAQREGAKGLEREGAKGLEREGAKGHEDTKREGREGRAIRNPQSAIRNSQWLPAWWLLGFLLFLLPWMVRSVRLTGGPVFSLYWYELLAQTETYPGESLWRTAKPPPHPFVFLGSHPMQMGRKLLQGLNYFWRAAPNLIHPMVGFLFLAALLEKGKDRTWIRFLGVIGGSLVAGVGGACLLRPDPLLLLAWTPLLALIGASYWVDWISPVRDPVSGRTEWQPGRWVRWGWWGGTAALLLFPLGFFLSLEPAGPGPVAQRMVGRLSQLVPEEATVLTDQPAGVAWYADRRAVWLFQQEEDWDRLARAGGTVDAVYLTPALDQTAANERSEWWFWLRSPQGVYRDFAPVNTRLVPGLLRLRPGRMGGQGDKGTRGQEDKRTGDGAGSPKSEVRSPTNPQSAIRNPQ